LQEQIMERRTHAEERPRNGNARIAAWAVAALALGVVAAGCGSQQQKSSSRSADAGVITVPVHETSRQAQAADYQPESRKATPSAAQPPVRSTSEDGSVMPPDIIVTASSTVVSPGEVIEIAVQATPDVTEMSLWDGLNDRQALAYDSEAKAWRVSYRVPLKLPWERTGLAITARNDGQRWCRQWVFVEKASAMAATDSVSGTPQAMAGDIVEIVEK
jgi:hypothetical protein